MPSKVTPKAPSAKGKSKASTTTTKAAAKKNVELRDLKKPSRKTLKKKH